MECFNKRFSSYFDFSSIVDQGVDSVATIARRKPVSASQADLVFDENDFLSHSNKPVLNKRSSYTKAQWEALPDRLSIRQIKVQVTQKGFRSTHFYIATTLLDPERYPANKITEYTLIVGMLNSHFAI